MVYGGVIADRVPRRTLMIITQSVMMVLAFVLAGLVFFDLVQPWHILVLAFLLGTANAFDTPARQSFVVELVEREDVTNAIAFNGTMFNTGAILGPAFGGLVYAWVGPGWCFNINGISFIAVIVALALMRITLLPTLPPRMPVGKAIKEGFQYVRADRLTSTLTLSVFVVNVLGFGLITLAPAWAVKILHGDVTTNGLLLSARGIGAVIGGLIIAALSAHGLRGKMWSISSFLMPLIILGFSFARDLPLSLLLMGAMGFCLITMMNNSNAMVQSRVPDILRGRVMALYSMMFMGGGPVGSLLVGVVAERIGEPTTAFICGVLLFIFAIIIWKVRPEVRKMA
jgi:MFS family permease